MDTVTAGIVCTAGFIFLVLLGIPIVFSVGFSALVIALLTYGSSSLAKLGGGAFYVLNDLNLIPLPLFVLIGCVIAETTMGAELFNVARKWITRLRGGLIVSGIIGEAIMSAAMGTSIACILVVGKSAVREYVKYGYKKEFGLGALLAGGCLGPLIPPSAVMIIYSVLANVSLGQLFTAGIIPGILLAAMLSFTAMLVCRLKPDWAPDVKKEEKFSWGEKFSSLRKVWPIVILIFSILGSIYLGVATPSEAAGIGSVVVLLLAFLVFNLRLDGLKRVLEETAIISAIIMFLFIATSFFSYVVGSVNVAKFLPQLIENLGVSPWMVIIVINIILLFLGCIVDALTITLLTVPIFVPLITALGFDPIWFGVVFLVNTQIGLITPPLGIDLFTASLAFDVPLGDLLRGVLPFLVILLLFLGLIIAFPALSLWLLGLR